LSCCASIANDEFGQQQHSLGILFVNIFFPFFFSPTERTRFVWCVLLVDRLPNQQKQVVRHLLCCVCVLQSGCQSHNELHFSCCASIANDEFGKSTTFSGNSFCEYFFPFFLFSHRENAFKCLLIARRTTSRSAEAGGKSCALLYVRAATGMPVTQRAALVFLRVDRK
jgi:hypothetical protein